MSTGWTERSIASLATYVNGYPFKPEDHSHEGLPIIRIKQLNDPTADVDYFQGVVPPRNHINNGDLIFSWSGTLSVGIWDRGPALLNQHLFKVLPARDISREWLRWLLYVAADLFDPYMHGSAMTHITQPMMRQVRVLVPPLGEQRRIAGLLDGQVALIDDAVRLRQTQVDLLGERSQAILEASTRGVGTPIRLKYAVNEIDERAGTEPDASELLSVSIHLGVVPRMEITDDPPRADSLAAYKRVRPGDIVLNRMRAFQGGVGVAHRGGVVSPDYAVLRPGDKADSGFLSHLFRAPWFVSEMTTRLRGIGGTDQGAVRTPRVNVADLLDTVVELPPLQEQRRTALSLDEQLDGVRAARSALEQSSHRLQERKRSLITASVTGNLDPSTMSAPVSAVVGAE